MATQMDLDQQDRAAQLLREGSRLLYTVAAGQFFQIDDVNAWFERFNELAREFENADLGDPYGAIAQRTSEADPLIDRATQLLDDLAERAAKARGDFAAEVETAQQGGGQ